MTIIPLKQLFFGTIFAISATIAAAGLIGDWWAIALLLPAGATLGWKIGERV